MEGEFFVTFDKVLKTCLQLTHTKLNVLSKEVGYDPSYLSRFSNGLLLPNPRQAKSLCLSLAQYFSKAILQQNLLFEVQKEFELDELTEESLQEQLAKLFFNSYKTSALEKSRSIKINKEAELLDSVSFIIELKDIIKETKPDTLIYQCPASLIDKLNLTKTHQVVESAYQFIYIPDVCFYFIQYFEEHQKLVVARLSQPQQLREIEYMLNIEV